MTELFGEHNGIHSECLVLSDIVRPVDLPNLLIDIIRTSGFEVADGLQNSDSGV